MKLQGQITLLVNQDYTEITVRDDISSSVVCVVTLTPKQLSQALSRLGNTPCEITVYPSTVSRWGKVLEVDSFTFLLPTELSGASARNTQGVCEYAQTIAPDGWIVDSYFGSQKSFFHDEDRNRCARATIRRWV